MLQHRENDINHLRIWLNIAQDKVKFTLSDTVHCDFMVTTDLTLPFSLTTSTVATGSAQAESLMETIMSLASSSSSLLQTFSLRASKNVWGLKNITVQFSFTYRFTLASSQSWVLLEPHHPAGLKNFQATVHSWVKTYQPNLCQPIPINKISVFL